ncbi:hypothetical protein FHT71_001982 [Rhizobium sp. BK060]|nr:hypothetical protein [Rhizobium sp. BK060]
MSVSEWLGSGISWEGELSALKARLGVAFRRSEAREGCGAFIDGLSPRRRSCRQKTWIAVAFSQNVRSACMTRGLVFGNSTPLT